MFVSFEPILVSTPELSAEKQYAMANIVVHFEIHASEPQKLIDFYSILLGRSFQDHGGGDQPYWVIDTGEGASATSRASQATGSTAA